MEAAPPPVSEKEVIQVGALDDIDDEDLDFFGFSDDEESSDEEVCVPAIGGGSDSEGDDEVSLAGMSLANPNPFFKRMRKMDPSLFLVQNEGNYKAYSRLCPWNVRRQPVILTQEEKDQIDKNHPGSYDHAIVRNNQEQNWQYAQGTGVFAIMLVLLRSKPSREIRSNHPS